MKEYRIDFMNVEINEEFYTRIIKGLKLPDWCGKNPDAIWDMVTGCMEHEASIYIEGFGSLPEELEKDAKILSEILNDAEKLYEGKFKVYFIS